jgi:hypothetical protein
LRSRSTSSVGGIIPTIDHVHAINREGRTMSINAVLLSHNDCMRDILAGNTVHCPFDRWMKWRLLLLRTRCNNERGRTRYGESQSAHAVDLTRYGWNLSVVFCGIIPSNPVGYPGGVRQKRNHGRIVPNYSAFRKRNDSRVTLSSSRNAVSFSSACTTNRFPSSRCASATKIIGP